MQRTDSGTTVGINRHKTQSSTTLNRRYVRRPAMSNDMMAPARRRIQVTEFKEMKEESRPSAKELKDQAIKKALAEATMKSSDQQMDKKTVKNKKKNSNKLHFGFGRVMLALSCAAVAVLAIVYFVNLNMPDISLRVAAMQTGINASYPGYVPRDYSVSSITSENGKITMDFQNNTTNDSFTLIEEVSSWDSNALLTNYIKEEYKDNYTVVREQGLTIFISGSNAAWVNGGVLYKIKTDSSSLTNKQIKTIATSL